MIQQDKGVEEIVQQLLNNSISPYDAVDLIRREQEQLAPSIRMLMVNHKSPYVRLCAAWSLGEIGDRDSVSLLKEAYEKEKEKNVRANIVWSLFMIDPNQIDLFLLQKFLIDNYFVIPLIALKKISRIPHLQGKIDFNEVYDKFNNILLKLEILRNIRSFLISKDINSSLKKELYESNDFPVQMGLIRAIGATSQIDSVDILIEYYYDHRNEILKNDSLAFQYVTAVLSLAQSKPYETLQEIYIAFKSKLIRWKTIEALASAGGPNCVDVLKIIYRLEDDIQLKEQIRKFVDIIPITLK